VRPAAGASLPGGDIASVDAEVSAAREAAGADDVARRLVYAYGSGWRDVWECAARTPTGRARLVPGLPYLVGEMTYGVARELACTLGDLLIRRTRIAFETPDHGSSVAATVADAVGPQLGWSPAQRGAELERFRREVSRIFTIEAR
jgi:glycerol-3-phosphate dehydrogenase